MNKIKNIKLVVTDIDGVWTDAKMHYTNDGDFMKSFSTYDGMAVQILREKGLETVIITSENSKIVLERAKKLKIENIVLNEKNKLKKLKEICASKKISLKEVAYIGDDLNDVEVLENVGFSALSNNSPIKDKVNVDYVTVRKGGDGAFREFADLIIKER
ncbi:MAG: acylneuraminate cytidylyltransferase [Candidatus Marinimicrobia bacterium]|nr:acylneuraminate cytidylyltransferase [Candidatus Neomarinimicrobiota bacterium]|tara:strand:+ start:58 stop:534 length:477 start_codon:yes stop_codon:yes gene_type:complete